MQLLLRAVTAAVFGVSILSAQVLVTVNGESVTQEEVQMLLTESQLPDLDAIEEADRQRLIESMVDRKLLAQHAKAQGIQKDESYQRTLNLLKENLMIDAWLESYAMALPVGETEARKIYEENKERFMQPEQVRARHILVESESDAKAIIADLGRLKSAALEQRFSQVAQERSIDPGSGQKGGDLGFFAKDRMVPEFADAAFGLKKGEMTKAPVQSAFGFHIIYLVDRKAAESTPYESVAEQMKNHARMQKFEERLESLTQELREKAKITYPN